MYVITMTGSENMWARDEEYVIKYALDYARKYGNYSGMEEWNEGCMREWITTELERALSSYDEKVLELYISSPEGHEFVVRREG